MARIQVKGWSDFQHYKHRSPPWIKLHKKLLDDFEFQCLQLASRALAPMLWLLASESDDGTFEADMDMIAFRLRTTKNEVVNAIIPLIDKGFLIDASNALAECRQVAILEKSRDRVETEKPVCAKSQIIDDGFNEFWLAYPKKTAKDNAIKAWKKKKPKINDVLIALNWQKESHEWKKDNGQFIPLPATYLNSGRWQDERPKDDFIDFVEARTLGVIINANQ